jgi:hypothetical protein
MTTQQTVHFYHVALAVFEDDRDRAWELLWQMTPTRLADFEDALDTLQGLVDARRAATTLLKLHGGGWDAESIEQPTPPPLTGLH